MSKKALSLPEMNFKLLVKYLVSNSYRKISHSSLNSLFKSKFFLIVSALSVLDLLEYIMESFKIPILIPSLANISSNIFSETTSLFSLILSFIPVDVIL